jgi:hypothetical protein
MSRQIAFGVEAATEITAAERAWVGEAAERIARSDAHLAGNLRDGTCWCGGVGHQDVVYSPALIRDAASQLGVSQDRASRLVRAAEDAAGCGPDGKLGF